MEEDDKEYRKLPAEERCVHKLWKARVSGYEEVAKLFRQIDDEKSPEFSKYLGLVKKFVIDSNAMGQEKGLEATVAYVENYAHAGKTVNEVMTGVVTKCIAAPKTRTKELALQLTLTYIEIEKYEAVVDELIKGMEQKNPKIVAACVYAVTIALKEFGSKVINVKPLVKKISVLFADRDKTVRDEARKMVIEIYRWIGPALKTQLNNLQPVQITELEAEFAKITGGKPIPTRYIRSQQHKQVIISSEGNIIEGETGEEQEDDVDSPQIDPYDLADPVDILSKLPKDFYEKLESKKWVERKEVLENLENLVKSPKLENGDYGDLIRALKKIIQKDTNVICVALAGRCIDGLATGLKKRFQIYASCLISTLFEKFKEKKQNVVQAIRGAIDAVYFTVTLESMLDDIIEALNNKNPSVKSETSGFLARVLPHTLPTVLNKKILKNLTTCLIKLLNEPDPSVRDAAAEAIGTMMKLVGEKAICPFLIELEKDNIKMTKIKECCDKAVIIVKIRGVKKERPTTTPGKVVKSQQQQQQQQPQQHVQKSAPTPVITKSANTKKKTEISSGSATIVRSKGSANTVNKVQQKINKIPVEKELNDNEVDELVANIIPSNVLNDLISSTWKLRLEAGEKLLSDLHNMESKEIPVQAIIKVISKKPGLKDTNFQVLKMKLDIIKYLSDKCKFSTTSANCCLLDLAEKFGDVKNGNAVVETMTSMAEATSLAFISSSLIEFAFKQKNPKVIQEILLWLANAINDFGFNNLNAPLIIDHCRKGLSSTNQGVRHATITLCGILYLYMGSTLNVFFENEKSSIRDQLNAEFDKYEGKKPQPPTKGNHHIKSSASTNSLDNLDNDDNNNDIDDVQNQINLHDLIPCIDISNQLTENIINEIEDKNWKVRNETLTKIYGIIQETKFIKPNLGNDFPQALVHRLSDSNTKIAQLALSICEAIAKTMGPPSKQYIKLFFPCFLQCLGDNKNWMRAASLGTINTYVEQCGYKEFFENEMIGDALKNGSPQLRIELWLWLAEKLPKIPLKSVPKEELTICLPYLYNNLEDRNVDVRKNAQEAILGFMMHLSYENMVKHTEKLKPGSKSVVMAALEKVRPNLPVKPLPSTKKTVEKEEKTIRGTKPVTNSAKTKSATLKNPAPVSRKKEEDIDTSPLLVVNNMKHQRTIDESKLRVLRWNFTTPREEFFELLKDQMLSANVNRNLMTNMFHIDFRYHIKAIDSLMEDLPNNSQALIANLDLILKWLTLRFFDTNPSVLLRGLEYLNCVFNVLIDNNYHMLENEASSFLPYLILKIGDPKDTVRNGVKSLFKQICNVYAVSRLFSYIMEGLKSKNARQRAECLDVLSTIILDFGITVCTPSPSSCLKEVAKQISDRDNSVRNAALNCVVQAYHIVGEKIYKMVGNISDKDLSLLEERIKRSKKTSKLLPKTDPLIISNSPQKDNNTFTTQQQNDDNDDDDDNNNNKENDIKDDDDDDDDDDDEDDLPNPLVLPPQIHQSINQTIETTGPFRLDPALINKLDKIPLMPTILNEIKEFDLEFLNEDLNMPSLSDVKAKMMPLSPPKPLDPNVSINKINTIQIENNNTSSNNDDLLTLINSMTSPDPAIILKSVQLLQTILNSPKGNLIIDYEDDFMRAIIIQLQNIPNKNSPEEINSKLCRSLLMVVNEFYGNEILGRNISMNILKDLLNSFVLLLTNEKLAVFPEDQLSYVRVINILCCKILENSDHTMILCALINLIQDCIRLGNCESRQTDLVMKCMWRLIKIMPTWDDDINYESVLVQIHYFFKEFPSIWWRNQPMDTPIRTVKTILHSLVKRKGCQILKYLAKIPNTQESEIESYIMKLLKSLDVDVNKVESTTKRVLSRSYHNTLTDIFQKIGVKDETEEGLNLLYDFKQKHPEADISSYLKTSSKFFQDYIQNGLDRIGNERKSSTIETFKEKVAESITSNSSSGNVVVVGDCERGPDYWKQRLEMWKKRMPFTTTNELEFN